jgi:hypothetical protein
MQREQEPEPEPEIEARTRQTDVWTRDMDGQSSSHEGIGINQSISFVRPCITARDWSRSVQKDLIYYA